MSLRPDRYGGELRSRSQQVGEYVPDVDEKGRSIPKKFALKERHKFKKILPTVADREVLKTNKILKSGTLAERLLVRQRLRITRQAIRKPLPGLRLANYEFFDVIRKHKLNKKKSRKEQEVEAAAKIKAF